MFNNLADLNSYRQIKYFYAYFQQISWFFLTWKSNTAIHFIFPEPEDPTISLLLKKYLFLSAKNRICL